MIKTAKVVDAAQGEGIGLFDRVELYLEEDDEIEHVQLVTSMRQDAMAGRITNRSPVGKAIWGRKPGDRVLVEVNDHYSYYVQIRAVEHGEDDASMPLLPY